MTIAFIPGLGMQEILLLGLCFMLFVVPVFIVVLVLVLNRKKSASGEARIRELEKENQQLVDDIRKRDRETE